MTKLANRTGLALLTTIAFSLLMALPAAHASDGPLDAAALETVIGDFLATDGDYTEIDTYYIELAIEDHVRAEGDESALLASGRLDPLVKAALVPRVMEGDLQRSRLHMHVRVIEADASPAADPERIVLASLQRCNLGPAIHAENVAAYGADNVAPAGEFGEGPHSEWRLVMQQLMGNNAVIWAASYRELEGEAAASCDETTTAIEDAAVWQGAEETDAAVALFETGFGFDAAGFPTPAGVLALAVERAGFDVYTAEVIGQDRVVAEVTVERNLGQDASVDAVVVQRELADDSLAAIWQRVTVFGDALTPAFYTDVAYECRRGDEGFAPAGEFCL